MAGADLREHLSERLPGHMVPATFTLLESLPLTPNGKVDRQALPAFTSAPVELPTEDLAPEGSVQTQLVVLWKELLQISHVGIHDNFFDIGGHSLLAVRLIHRIEQVFEQNLPVSILFAAPTIAGLANYLQPRSETISRDDEFSPLIKIHANGAGRPFWFLHGDFSGGFYCQDLSRHLGHDQPFYVMPPHGVGGGQIPPTIEAMATDYLQILRSVQPEGPYLLGGFCNGGLVAFEMAQQLQAQGERVDILTLVDVECVNTYCKLLLHTLMHIWARMTKMNSDRRFQRFLRLQQWLVPFDLSLKRGRDRWRTLFRSRSRRSEDDHTDPETIAREIQQQYFSVIDRYITQRYSGRITLIWSKEVWDQAHGDPIACWREVAEEVEYHEVPGSHFDCLTTHAPTLASILRSCRDRAISRD